VSAARRIRVLKFSLVGAIGIAVQLGTLALLVKVGVNYLWATAIAVEFAVLHNFLWHQHYTWADRGGSGLRQFLARLLRFHLSNGLVSLVGNLLLMRWLAGSLHWPILPANMLTITICFAANFLASEYWVFLADRE
jgi:putative flippase GtrA